MRTPFRLLPAAALLAALTFTGQPAADNPLLVGTTGPGFQISLTDASDTDVKHLDPGTYTLRVDDRSDQHNFHLSGPGVNVSTEVDFIGTKTFTITLTDGNYTFVCDPHNTLMLGRFTAGNPPPTTTAPKPAPRAAALRVGPGLTLVAPKRLAAGAYVITATDRSAKDNLHLRGPGVERRTGKSFRGTVRWRVSLAHGTYRVWSDAHPKLARTIAVA